MSEVKVLGNFLLTEEESGSIIIHKVFDTKAIFIPKNVIKIDSDAFENCRILEKIVVDQDNKYFKSGHSGANLYSKNKKSLLRATRRTKKIVESVTIIADYAFANLNIKEIELPKKLKVIDDFAFYNSQIEKILFPDELGIIGREAFFGTKIDEINIPASVTFIGENAFRSYNLSSINVNSKNLDYYSKDNCLLTMDKKMLLAGCESSIIPDTVSLIQASAFNNCNFKILYIPKSITNLEYAFSGCSYETLKVDKENKFYKEEGNCLLTKDGTTLILASKNAKIPSTVDTILLGSLDYEKDPILIIPKNIRSMYIGFGINNQNATIFYEGKKHDLILTALNKELIDVYYYSEKNLNDGNKYWRYNENGEILKL